MKEKEDLYSKGINNEQKFVDLCRRRLPIGKGFDVTSNIISVYKIDILIMLVDRKTIISEIEFEVVSEREDSYNPITQRGTPRFKDIHCPIEKKGNILKGKNSWYVRVNKEFNKKVYSLESLIGLGNTVYGYAIKGINLKKYPIKRVLAYSPDDNFTKKRYRYFILCDPYDINSKIGTITEVINFIYKRLGIIKTKGKIKLKDWILNQKTSNNISL